MTGDCRSIRSFLLLSTLRHFIVSYKTRPFFGCGISRRPEPGLLLGRTAGLGADGDGGRTGVLGDLDETGGIPSFHKKVLLLLRPGSKPVGLTKKPERM